MPAVTVCRRPAGEGSGHTARMHISEESHCGIVPMNHSNKDGISSAESEEGRLRIKENTLPLDTYPTQCRPARVPRVGECADKLFACRYSSEIRTGCANERPSGSVRGQPGNWCPYRDQQLLGDYTRTPVVTRLSPQDHDCFHGFDKVNCRERLMHVGSGVIHEFWRPIAVESKD
jgi:hypothetical protein